MFPSAIALQAPGAGSELWYRGRLSIRRESSHRGLTGTARGVGRRNIEVRHIDVFLNNFRSRRLQVASPISVVIGRRAISFGSGICSLGWE